MKQIYLLQILIIYLERELGKIKKKRIFVKVKEMNNLLLIRIHTYKTYERITLVVGNVNLNKRQFKLRPAIRTVK